MQNQSKQAMGIQDSVRRFLQAQDWRVLLVLVLLTAATSGLVYFRRIAYPTNNDYSTHVLYTQQIVDGEASEVPALNLAHPGLQFLLIGLYWLTFRLVGFYGLLILVLTGTQVLVALILYFIWFKEEKAKENAWRRAFFAFTLTLVTPVMLLAFWDGQYYFGYIGLANYHNPTIVILFPIALLSFMFAARLMSGERSTPVSILLSALLVVLSALVKPSFAVTILMGLAGITLLHLLQKKPVDWRMLVLGFALPAGVTLAAQWVYLYLMHDTGDGGILLRPFEVEAAFSGNLLPKFILSVLFPASVLLAYFRDALRKVEVQLAWLTFLAGALQMYLLAEGGERFFHGNFRWSAQIALYLLFAVSARYLLQRLAKADLPASRSRLLVYLFYLAHVLAGAAYYLHVLFAADYG